MKWSLKVNISALIDQYQNLIFSICYRTIGDYFAAEDLTQDTFLSAYRSLDTFDGENEKAWLCRIAVNKCTDYLKSAKRRQEPMDIADMPELQSKEGLPEQEAYEEVVRNTLLTYCQSLKSPYGEVAVLYFHEENSPEEIAIKLHRKLKTVQTQIYRARSMLQALYRKEEPKWNKDT